MIIVREIRGEDYRLVPHCKPKTCVGCVFDDDRFGCTAAGWDCMENDSIWIKEVK